MAGEPDLVALRSSGTESRDCRPSMLALPRCTPYPLYFWYFLCLLCLLYLRPPCHSCAACRQSTDRWAKRPRHGGAANARYDRPVLFSALLRHALGITPPFPRLYSAIRSALSRHAKGLARHALLRTYCRQGGSCQEAGSPLRRRPWPARREDSRQAAALSSRHAPPGSAGGGERVARPGWEPAQARRVEGWTPPTDSRLGTDPRLLYFLRPGHQNPSPALPCVWPAPGPGLGRERR